MKTNKTLLAAAVAAALSPAAFGQSIDLYLTGSSAFKTTVRSVITTVVAPGGTTLVGDQPRDDGTKCWVYRGTVGTDSRVQPLGISGRTLTVYECYAGSSEGVNDTKNGGTAIQYKDINNNNVNHIPDAFFSDTTMDNANPPASDGNFEFTPTPIGVISFVFVKNAGPALTTVTNITRDQAQTLFSQNGLLNPAYLGGANVGADAEHAVWLLGRYRQSGTRIVLEKVMSFQEQTLYNVTKAGGPTVWGNYSYAGFTSGGTLRDTLINASYAGYNLIGYLGMNDAVTATAADGSVTWKLGLTALSYNGVPWSKANVANGSYPLWSIERSSVRTGIGIGSPDVLKAYNAIMAVLMDTDYQLANFLGPVLPLDTVPGSAMNVSRSGDGTAITPDY